MRMVSCTERMDPLRFGQMDPKNGVGMASGIEKMGHPGSRRMAGKSGGSMIINPGKSVRMARSFGGETAICIAMTGQLRFTLMARKSGINGASYTGMMGQPGFCQTAHKSGINMMNYIERMARL